VPEKDITRFYEAFHMEIIVELDDPFLVGFVALETFDTEEKVADDSMDPWPNSKCIHLRVRA